MSDNKDNLDLKSQNSSTQPTKQSVVVSKESVVEVAKKHSAKDMLLWFFAIIAMILATLVSEYLPRYWAAANDIWVQIGITVALVIFGFVCLAFTNQGAAFKTLLKDAGIELRRIKWPSKDETVRYTWQVIVVMIIFGVIIWLFDLFFNYIFGLII